MRRTFTITTALVLSAFALAGCSAGFAGSSDEAPTEQSEGVRAPEIAQDGGAATEADTGDDSVDRSVITTGWVTITVDEPKDAAAEAVRITESVGGRIDARNEYGPLGGDKGSASLTLRIPSEALTSTLDKLRELGEVEEVSLNASDVTMQTQDLEARINARQESLDRMIALLATATDMESLITLETAIAERQGELESLKSEQRYLADQVSMSTITLTFISVADAPVDEPDTFVSGLVAGWNAFVAFFAGLLVALGVLLPWLIFAGIVTIVVIWIVRRSRRNGQAVAAPSVEEEPAAQAPAKTK